MRFHISIVLEGSYRSDMPQRVLFLCAGNSARSQIAEGLLRRIGAGRFDVASAGTQPRDEVHPLAVRVMSDIGYDIRGQHPKDVSTFAGEKFDFVITVCDRARESCPVIPGAEAIHWSFGDPAEDADEERRIRAFRDTVQGLKRRIELFVTVHREAR
jgi:protein-tyrosine-phosphatase